MFFALYICTPFKFTFTDLKLLRMNIKEFYINQETYLFYIQSYKGQNSQRCAVMDLLARPKLIWILKVLCNLTNIVGPIWKWCNHICDPTIFMGLQKFGHSELGPFWAQRFRYIQGLYRETSCRNVLNPYPWILEKNLKHGTVTERVSWEKNPELSVASFLYVPVLWNFFPESALGDGPKKWHIFLFSTASFHTYWHIPFEISIIR